MKSEKKLTRWVLIHAQFSKKVPTKTRNNIYDCIGEKWTKIHNDDIDLSTTWIMRKTGVTARTIKFAALREFLECIEKGVTVELIIHIGASMPNLVKFPFKKK